MALVEAKKNPRMSYSKRTAFVLSSIRRWNSLPRVLWWIISVLFLGGGALWYVPDAAAIVRLFKRSWNILLLKVKY